MASSNRCFPKMGLRITLHKKSKPGPGKTNASASSSSSSSSSSLSLSPSSSSCRCRSLTPRRTREEELKDIFRHFDLDNDGLISALELRRYFNSIGEIVSQEEAQEVIDELDSDNDGMLEFEDFVKFMDNNTKENDDELKKVFETFEHQKGSGRITPRGLQRAFHRLGDSKSFKECTAMIQVYDANGDGELDFNDFHHMMAV